MNRFILGLIFLVLACISAEATTYYSQGNPSQSFADLTNWDTNTGGGGADPVAGDLTSGTHVFVVQDGHTVQIDQDINVDALIVNTASALLEIGNDATARDVQVVSSLYVNSGGTFRTQNSTVTHTFSLTGSGASINNLGNMQFWRDGNSVTDVVISGAGLLSVSASSSISFNEFTINGGGTVTSSGTINIVGDFNVSGNSTIKGNPFLYASQDVNVSAGSTISFTGANFYMQSSAHQTITCDGDCGFYYLMLNNGPGVNGIKTVNGVIEVRRQLRVYDDAVFTGSDSVILKRDIVLYGTDGWNGSGPVILGSDGVTGAINTNGNVTQLGTSKLVLVGNASLSNNSTQLVLDNDLEIEANLILNASATLSQLTTNSNSFTMGSSSRLYVRGFQNFPSGFNSYTLDPDSRVDYDANLANQRVVGGLTYGDVYMRYGVKWATDDLDINGDLMLRGTDLNLRDLFPPNNEFNINLGEDITGQSGDGSTINCTLDFTLDGVDVNQTLNQHNTYNLNNFIIDNVGPITNIRTKNLDADITVDGDFTATNSGGDASNLLVIDIDNNSLIANGGGFTLNDNVLFKTSGATAFGDMFDGTLPSFGSVTLTDESIVEFDRSTDQDVPGLTYGNIVLDNNGDKNLTGDIIVNGSVDGNRDNLVFKDNGYTITLYGDWDFGSFGNGLNRTEMTGKFIFAGADQISNESNFDTVIFQGSGTKTLLFTIDVDCGMTIETGVTVTSLYDIYLGCDLTVNGTGVLTHKEQEFFLDGTTGDQQITIADPTTSYLYNLELMNSSGTTILNSDLVVKGSVDFQNGTLVTLNMDDDSLFIGKDIYMYGEDILSMTNGTMIFYGNADQTIRNGNAATVYNNMYFRTGGEKNFTTNTFDINGDVVSEAGLTLDQNGIQLNVEGDWTHLGSITGGAGADIYFDGADQTIKGIEFNTVYFDGTGTKTLASSFSAKGHVFIEGTSTLDVSASNYKITVEGNWRNDAGGVFNARSGTVLFNGGIGTIYTGGTGAGNSFYNVEVELTPNTSYIVIGNSIGADDNLDVDNDLTVSAGIFYTSSRDIYLGGDLVVESNGRYYGNSGSHDLIFDDGTTGTKIWQPGVNDVYRQIEFDGVGSTWEMHGNARLSNGKDIIITNGKLDLNHNNLTLNASNADITVLGSNSELEIDSGAVLTMGSTSGGNVSELLNSGGTVTLLGTETGIATITSTGHFRFTQTGATSSVSANYYKIHGTNLNGVDIQGGTVHSINNFSNGQFSGGYNNAYLTFADGVFSAADTLRNVAFNERSNGNPTYNVSYSGTNVLTFEDAKGSSAGASREDDDGVATTGQVLWTYTASFFWDGASDGDGDGSSWEDPENWTTDIVPTSGSDVILNNDYVNNYTVNIDAADAYASSLDIIEDGSVIVVDLNGYNLHVSGGISVGSGAEIEQSNATDTIFVGGGWSNTSGRLDDRGTGAPIVFTSVGGSYNISTNSNNNDLRNLNNVVFQGSGYYTFTDRTEIENDLLVVGGTIDIGDVSNEIQIQGDFTVSDSGAFVHSNGLVRFEGTTGTQTLTMGAYPLYDITFQGGAAKTIGGNLIVSNDFRIEATSNTVSGGENLIYVNNDWRNLKGNTGFSQTGNGSVVFNGNVTQDIGRATDASTIFNTLILQSTGQKVIAQDLQINKDLLILMGASGSVVEIQPGVSINGNGGDNDLLMQDGILRVESLNGFPANFELVNMLGGEVRYESDGIDQNIYATEYYRLRIREVGGALTTKTALGDITVTNTFYNTNDVFTELDMNCHTLTLNGTMDIEPGAPDIEWGNCGQSNCQGGGTLVIGDGINALDVDVTSFNNLTIDNSGNSEFRLQSDITVNGDLQFQNSSRVDMRQFTITNTCLDPTNTTEFVVESNVEIETQVASGSFALPSGFGSISLSTSSLIEYQLGGDQDIFTDGGDLVYGNLDLESSGAKILDGNLHVDGNFNMDGSSTLSDNNFNMVFSGGLIAFNPYVPSVGTNILFDGNDQTIRSDNSNLVDFRDVEFTGTGTKLFWDDETYNFLGDVKIGASVHIDMTTYDQDVSFSGDSVIVLGSLSHNGGNNDFRFNKTGTQILDLGPNHDLAHLEIKTGANVFVKNYGLNITGNGGTQNFVEIESGASLDLDTMTHLIGQDNFIIDGTLLALNANLTFNQTGEQNIDAFIAQDVILSGSGDKDMEGIWRMNNLTITDAARLDFDNEDTLVIRGNFDCYADVDREDGVVLFEMDDSDARTIRTNNEYFSQMKFISTGGNSAVYTLLDDLNIDDSLRLGTNATLDINGNTFTLGSPNDGGGSDESLVIESGAELQLDAGASLLVECNGTDANIDVYGTLSILGSSTETANISRYVGNNEIDIDVLSGGTIEAKNYVISNLVDEGILIVDGATIDPVNNFSNGVLSNMQEGVGATYLTVEADVSLLDTIKNITFSHSGPTIGNDYNVTRTRVDGGVLIFGDEVLGLLGSYEYENETASPGLGDRIVWPTKTETNWLGLSSDWFADANWDNGVPDITKNAIIGKKAFDPIISSGAADTAKCKQLLIKENGTRLTVSDGIDLKIVSDLVLGTGSENSQIIVSNASSDIIIGGSWTTSSNASFTNGGAKVVFNLNSGTATVDISNLTLNDIDFIGAASFNISGDLDIDGDVRISSGSVNPSLNNYVYNVSGNWDASGGVFNSAINGTVIFDGPIQTINSANFDQVTFTGTGCDTLKGNVSFADELIINTCVIAATGSYVDFNDDVTINLSGSFDDGGETHDFSGVNWTGTGGFAVNTGTINFDRTGGTQNIFASTFNNLSFNGTSRIELEGDVDVVNNVYISNSINNFYTKKKILDNTGVGTLTIESGENIYIDGANNFPTNFDVYDLHESSNTRFNGTSDQIINGGVTYGNLILSNANTKTLSGNINVLGDIRLGASTLDVSASNYSISVGDDWNNDAGGSFVARNGTVIFDGTGRQYISPGEHPSDGVKKFWNITVNKASENVDVNGADIIIDSNLTVSSGEFTLAGVGDGFTGYLGGNLTTTGSGTIGNTGVFYFNSDDNATLNISILGNTLRDVIINSSSNTTYQIGSTLTVDGDFNLMTGTVDGNNQLVELGTNINDAVTISGVYRVNNGVLALGNQTSLTVTPAGEFDVVGSQSDPSIVTRRYSYGDYNFTVNGTIKARDYVFENFSAQGISINNGAIIDATDNLSDGTFANPATAGTCLRIENTQKFTNANRIENVSFPQDPGSGTYNVTKAIAASDSIEFYNASGALAGESKDNDPLGIIIWTGAVKLIWTGAVSTDWYNVANWSATSGPAQVPDSTFDVIIPVVSNQPIITVSGAQAKILTIESGGILTIQTPNDTASDIKIYDELILQGLLKTQTSNDVIEVNGNWTRSGGGTYLYGSGGKVLFTGETGTVTINNGGASFYDLEINRTGLIYLSTDVNIDNDINIVQGTLDVSTSSYDITVKGSFINDGTFNSRSGTVEMTSTGGESIQTNGSEFYDLIVSGSGTFTSVGTVSVNNIYSQTAGVFDLNSQIFKTGDASGTDLFEVKGGEFIVDANANLQMASNSDITVTSGGQITLIGTDLSNPAKVSNQGGSTKYNFNVSSGGKISALYYEIEDLGLNGLDIKTFGSINSTNNLSYGVFRDGTAGGTYITMRNYQDLSGNDRIEYVEFETDPGSGANNIIKTSAIGPVEFYYSIGILSGEDHEDDPNDLVEWDADMVWTGVIDSDWSDPLNWDATLAIVIPNLTPNDTTDVIIPNVATNDPILDVDGFSDDLIVEAGGGFLTLNNNNDLTVSGEVSIEGVLTIDPASTTNLNVYGSWNSTVGTFNSGNNSVVSFYTETETVTLNTNDTFCGLKVNSQGDGTGTVQTASSIDVDCDFVVVKGTFEIVDPTHVFNLAGNWDNQSLVASTGFTGGSGTVVFDGASDQAITHAGGTESFYNITIANTGGSTVTLNDNIDVTNDIVIQATSILDGQSNTLSLSGDWVNGNATGFVESTSTVAFTGSTIQLLTHAGTGETFYNLTLDNSTAGTALSPTEDVTITNLFTQTDGIISTGANELVLTSTVAANYTGWSSTNYVNGSIRRSIGSNTSTYAFPVSKSVAGSDYYLIELINNNLTGTSNILGSVSSITESGNNDDSKLSVKEGPDAGGVYYSSVAGETAIWTLSPDIQPTGGTYGIDAHIANFTGLSDSLFGLLKRPEGSTDYADWDDAYPATIPAAGEAGRMVADGFARRTGYTSFSEFTIGISSQPLPIELRSFDAVSKEGYVLLTWETASENNNDFFTIQRSVDGVNFEDIGVIKGAGNSVELNSYNYADKKPFNGISYYRLVQTDYNGNAETFEIRSVNHISNKVVQLYPTPVVDLLTVSGVGLVETNSTIKVYSILGELLLSIKPTNDISTIDLSDLRSGMYTVVVSNEQFNYTEVIIVTK